MTSHLPQSPEGHQHVRCERDHLMFPNRFRLSAYTKPPAQSAGGQVPSYQVVVKRHGVVTRRYIGYNRRDVLATSELAVKLLEEYDKHPINLQATKAYSPASIGKAYAHRTPLTNVALFVSQEFAESIRPALIWIIAKSMSKFVRNGQIEEFIKANLPFWQKFQ